MVQLNMIFLLRYDSMLRNLRYCRIKWHEKGSQHGQRGPTVAVISRACMRGEAHGESAYNLQVL
jgi:hypothetical protein